MCLFANLFAKLLEQSDLLGVLWKILTKLMGF